MLKQKVTANDGVFTNTAIQSPHQNEIFDAGGEFSYAEIARKLGITEEYARVLEWSALRKIKRHLGAKRWHEWREFLRSGILS